MDKLLVLAASIILAAIIVAASFFYSPVKTTMKTLTETTTVTRTLTKTITITITETVTATETKPETTTTTTTRFEKLEIVNAYADYNKSIPGWTVIVKIKNTGIIETVIDKILVNNKPYKTLSLSIKPGEIKELKLYLDNKHYSSGQTISIVIHTASDRQYPATITLP